MEISIHAPAKGATQAKAVVMEIGQFQSTLPRRERLHLSTSVPSTLNFNPRSREGSDQIDTMQFAFSLISIHAPAKGATINEIPVLYMKKDFNPRSREGSDGV